ncbi:hypothetical protein ABZ135_36925 [Streptomyces sp. NPDC006339]|uniref:hypothetical protein n=1 Tax=Streptomyces sp. NPDC006339 TaxID=3156755 RepID=UPI0033BE428B
MPDDLHQRYQRAASAVRSHDAECPTCTATTRCQAGARLWESFTRLQDAYLNRNRR